MAQVPSGKALIGARHRQDGILVVGSPHELDARWQALGRKAIRDSDSRHSEAVANGTHNVFGRAPNSAAKLLIERGGWGGTRWSHESIKASEYSIHLFGYDAAQTQSADIVLRQHCSTHIRAVVVLWSGQLRRLATLNKLLESTGGFSEQDRAGDFFVGQIRQRNLLDTGNLGQRLESVLKIAAHGLVHVCRDAFEHAEP